jgi:hypothetical protein
MNVMATIIALSNTVTPLKNGKRETDRKENKRIRAKRKIMERCERLYF